MTYKVTFLWIAILVCACKVDATQTKKAEIQTADISAKRSLPHPGQPKATEALIKKLDDAVQYKVKSNSKFRTKHKDKRGLPKYTNRLVLESSPYLQQHAHNPVNWYSWGDEAFENAAASGKPVFLSIGYSTCHWCHVMEEESFEDLEIAKYLNENYIAIKVDREERPGIDGLYMQAVRFLNNGRGGWPMSVWLTHEGTPFRGGTYFPARTGDRGSRVGFLTLLERYKTEYADPATSIRAQEITKKIGQSLHLKAPEDPTLKERNQPLRSAMAYIEGSFDTKNGGWGRTKFPMPSRLTFMMRYYRRSGAKADMLFQTLDAMASGGIYDQIGGGFHRYTVDSKWIIPHFEKMLYDNAQLAKLYTQAYAFSGNQVYKTIAIETLEYLEKEMMVQSEFSGIFAATDADSDGEEGTFFVWTPEEFDSLLGVDSEFAKELFGITKTGNFEGKNILTRRADSKLLLAKVRMRKQYNVTEADFQKRVQKIKGILYKARKKRVPPDRDDKIVSAWNALAADAFAYAGFIFERPDFVNRSRLILDFIEKELHKEGHLYRSGIRLRGRKSSFQRGPLAVADDYAFTIHALLRLFQITSELKWMRQAEVLQKEFDTFFMDDKGIYNRRSSKAPPALVNEKAWEDGAIPSANGYASMNSVIWKSITTLEKWEKRSSQLFGSYKRVFEGSPTRSTTMLRALDGYGDKSKEVFIVGPRPDEFLQKLRSFRPNSVFFVSEKMASSEMVKAVPWLEKKGLKNEKTTAYVCHAFVCKLPTNDPEVFAKQLDDMEAL